MLSRIQGDGVRQLGSQYISIWNGEGGRVVSTKCLVLLNLGRLRVGVAGGLAGGVERPT